MADDRTEALIGRNRVLLALAAIVLARPCSDCSAHERTAARAQKLHSVAEVASLLSGSMGATGTI
jgi:hypothetical protein